MKNFKIREKKLSIFYNNIVMNDVSFIGKSFNQSS